ncbi:MAG: D-alanyl-D-alanine carboxypeptidase [Lachnospiraceae bacterium]|nr:D-alanyl-D-alanine carboxypeptidase [Lachnospiraceae bacterium]
MKKLKAVPVFILCLALFTGITSFADKVIIADAPYFDVPAQNSGNTKTNPQAGTDAASDVAEPEIASEAGVLYDATTGKVLFEKNGYKSMYPASTTKIMTALLAAEKLPLSTRFTFSKSAAEGLESGYTNVSMVTGDTMTIEDALYALMLKSACEVANGIAEAVSGDQASFAALMNSRARELGCTNTSFKNASGLNDSSHLTCAYDMALITKAAFENETVKKICMTKSWKLPASKKRGELTVTNSNKMLYKENSQYFEGIVGGKTGYTSKAGNTLCEVAVVKGHTLVAVVMKSSGKQYTDVLALFNYGKKVLP